MMKRVVSLRGNPSLIGSRNTGVILFLYCSAIKTWQQGDSPEGFQRAIGKPFGRARRREISALSKSIVLSENSIIWHQASITRFVYAEPVRLSMQSCRDENSVLWCCKWIPVSISGQEKALPLMACLSHCETAPRKQGREITLRAFRARPRCGPRRRVRRTFRPPHRPGCRRCSRSAPGCPA